MSRDVIEGCLSNVEFAEKVGIHFSMASKLRHGKRKPSAKLAMKIWKEYDLPTDDLWKILEGDQEESGRYLRERVFRDQVA